jgi:hypothetical protein
MILVACEESQVLTKALRNKGLPAFSCDIVDTSGDNPEWHIKRDAIKEAYSGKYDAIIAFPPCTYMTKGSACRMYPKAGIIDKERLKKGLEAKSFFMALWNAPVKKVCIENPVPLKVIDLPMHSQSIDPSWFGHPYSKKTLLWLRGLPPLFATDIIENPTPYLPSNTGGKKRGQKYKHSGAMSKKDRSRTFEGVASAMASQWYKILSR